MNEREAILGFMMGERLKAGLIAAGSLLQVLESLSGEEKRGAERLFRVYLNGLISETTLAERVSPQDEWGYIRGSLETGIVMVSSGAPQGAYHHLTEAISRATTVSSRTMQFLQGKGYL